MQRIADRIDQVLRWIGNLFAWTMLLLMMAIVTQVVLRYGFRVGMIKLEELQWHLYAMGMMIGLSYALLSDSHIRVDIFHQRFSKKTKAQIDIVGTLLLLLPFFGFLFWHSLSFVHTSFAGNERSNAPSGLPWRWVIKAFIPLACLALMAAACGNVLRCVATLRSK